MSWGVTMKAAVVGNDPAEAPLEVRDVPEPEATGDAVIVRLKRSALNRVDAMMLKHRTGEAPGTIFGSDGGRHRHGTRARDGNRCGRRRRGDHLAVAVLGIRRAGPRP